MVLTIVVVAGAAMLFGSSIKEPMAFGAMISLSSTAVVLRMLMERIAIMFPHMRE